MVESFYLCIEMCNHSQCSTVTELFFYISAHTISVSVKNVKVENDGDGVRNVFLFY